MSAHQACPLCGTSTPPARLAEAAWMSRAVEERIQRAHPHWRRGDGACPACVQQRLLEEAVARGGERLREGIQQVWPLDAEAAFGAIPTPLRMRSDPRLTGRGVTVAVVDAGFYPHADLVRPRNRIRAWVDAGREDVEVRWFGPDDAPRWPGWEARAAHQWHGLMTAVTAAGNGWLSHGLYRGMAPDAELVLVQVRDREGRIGNAAIARALGWLREHRRRLGLGVVNLSLGGDAVRPPAANPVDAAVAALVEDGVVVVAAAGNDGERRLVPPATAPHAITVGGLDDRNTVEAAERALWHSNYGEAADGAAKPELVAPSLWVVAPVLPGTEVAAEAAALFAWRAAAGARDERCEARIAALRLVTPHYQHVEGTSFAAPVVAGTAVCLREAGPALTPREVRALLLEACEPVAGAPAERQGAGALDAGRAARLALGGRRAVSEVSAA